MMGGRGIFGRFGNLNIMLFFDENSKQIHHRQLQNIQQNSLKQGTVSTSLFQASEISASPKTTTNLQDQTARNRILG